ncbi:MAG: Omp28-related outer membrane protein [Chlorobi bacterium]|nr:Omp28-related outer membrane protein [Chlorobiota bacterium]
MKKFTFLFISLFFIYTTTSFSQRTKNNLFYQTKIKNEIKSPENSSRTVTDWIYYCGDPAHSIGTGSAASFGCFIHIPASSLTAHDGRQIQEVMVLISQPEYVNSCELRIYEESGSGTPGTPVVSQSFTPNPDGDWTTVFLAPPYVIDASKDLMIGYFGDFSGGYPASSDDGPVNNDGNFMIWNGSWTHLNDLSSTLTYNWNIKAGIGDAPAYDAALTSITTNDIVSEGPVDITGVLMNFGTNQINSFDLNWQVDNGTVQTENINTNINAGESYSFTHGTQWNAVSGNYTLSVWCSNINGNGNDDNTANDTLTKNITVINELDVFAEKLFTPLYCTPEENITVKGKIINRGENDITSFDVTYNIDGGDESSVYSVTGVNIPYNESYTFTHDVPYSFNAEGNYTVTAVISNVNGGGETNTNNNSVSKSIEVSNSKTQRYVLLEQFTTEQCPNCPPVLTTLEEHFSENPYFIMMCHHSGYYTDWLTIPENTAHLEFFNSGESTYAPAGMFDREYNGLDNDNYGGVDPGPVFWDGDNFGTNRIDSRYMVPAEVTVNIDGTYSDNGNINVTVSGNFLQDVSHTVGVSLWITEDSIPANNQAGADNWIHRYATRDAVSERLGDEITTSTNAGDYYEKTYSYSLNDNWNTEQLYLVALVSDINNGNVNDRTVRNAVQLKLTDLEYVISVEDKNLENISVYPNPAFDKIKILNVKNADVKIFNVTGKMMLHEKNVSGNQFINISKLKSGTYFAEIKTKNNKIIKKLIISRQ